MSERNVDENTLWTPANIVTLVRILLVPVFVVAFISPWPDYFPEWQDADLWKPWIAAAIFTVLSCTDALDGYLARSRGEVTNFGKFIDPLADKILVCAALLALVDLQLLPSWVALIILGREFIVSGLRMLVATHGIVVAASWYGKAKTVTQIIAILLFIVKGSDLWLNVHAQAELILYGVAWLVMIVALVLTIVSMIDYFAKCAPVLGFGTIGQSKKDGGESKDADDAGEDVAEPADVVVEGQARELAGKVVSAACEAHLVVSTAESCTGGLIAGSLTAIPGSSEAVAGGIVSYSNDVKKAELGVAAHDLETVGAVSAEVAASMAEGSRRACGTDVAVSVTGIAGPGGAVPGKPVGTVWFGLADRTGTRTEVVVFPGDRDQVRAATVRHALTLLLEGIEASARA